MYEYKHNGQVIYTQVEIDGFTYTVDWLEKATDEQLANLSVTRTWVEPEVIEPPEPLPPVYTATASKFRIALWRAGLLDDVEVAVQQADRETQIMWEFEPVYYSNHPKLVAMAQTLGIDQEQLVALFIAVQG
jgi:hypothetical protein